jgi:PAS domain-containing protein
LVELKQKNLIWRRAKQKIILSLIRSWQTKHMINYKPDFQQLFEASPGLFILLSADFNIIAASDAYLQEGKVKREEVVGKIFLQLFLVMLTWL